MKRFIVTKQQLEEYVEKKRAEKIFDAILVDLFENSKKISGNVSITKANQTVIENYKRKKMLTPKVQKMLIEYKIIDEDTKVL